jgi:hypothetical protein
MWQLENRTPFAAERAWTRGRDGAEIWLVAVKCTFDIAADGRTEVAVRQPPIVITPEYVDPARPVQSSLKYDTDLVRTKTTTDVVVLGHAYAPQGRAVTELEAGFRVGPLVKRVRVVGDRVWHGGAMSAPQPFTKMPILYERAYGGADPASRGTDSPQWDVRNPLGTGFALSSSGLDGLSLPNVEYPDQPLRSWRDRPAPAGLGPVCAHWEPRAQLAGTYDDKWQQERLPLLPDDFDDRHYHCAPADQQAPQFLKGGEAVRLVNLTPGGELAFELPQVFLGFETFFLTGERCHHPKANLHTVIIEPEFPRISLVWHTALPCHPKVHKLEKTRIFVKRPVGASARVNLRTRYN